MEKSSSEQVISNNENPNKEAIERITTNLQEVFSAEEVAILRHGLGYWDENNLKNIAQFINNGELNERINQLVSELQSFELPNDVLPLSPERQPFENFDSDTIKKVIFFSLAYPEKRGRLTDIVCNKLGLKKEQLSNYLIVEAHLDATRMNNDLKSDGVRLGFETDNFNKVVPGHFFDHATLAFNIPSEKKERFQELKSLLDKNFDQLSVRVQEDPEVQAYAEAEIYSSKYIYNYDFKPISQKGLERFPLNKDSLLNIELPRTEKEAKDKDMPLATHKVADIHVKTPSGVLEEKFPGSETTEMNAMRQKLMDAGFYEVITEAGNKIYTAQFLNMEECLKVFNTLKDYFQEFGGARQIYTEPCPKFWRKESQQDGEAVLSEIPPGVRLHQKL